ncbi:tryptophanase [Micromonospora sp. HM5-17]|jgi:DMATS type aromatic prenyltransferase|uniref:tryptophanase n=1 Tax=Micromonospora sp. HM5-17 TaxID=2487710 RepID=UPI000F4826B2|nr:tryptophanase [Micromonospora sp. HM5-17]ROT33018.1 tryptophanase [Micromonospora sp. HM5-17]
MRGLSLVEHLSGQLAGLCRVAGTDPELPLELLADILGPAASRPLSEPPVWPSNVADDHTPVEFSVAFNRDEPPTLRILAEALGSPPGAAANLAAAYEFVERQARRFGLPTGRLDSLRELFATDHPQGEFALWHSLVFRHGRRPEFKVYLNPEVKGVAMAPELVKAALGRLGLGASYQALLDHGVRPGELGRRDRLAFFALDLHDAPHARVKLYLSHHDAQVRDVIRAAGLVDGIDPAELAEFCAVAGGPANVFDRRPLVSSYTFTGGADRPVGYSLYVPIRSYVADDEEARDRVATLLTRYGFDSSQLDRAIAALTSRPLRDGVGLLAHVSLRLGPPRPGVTVYLSAEAYRVLPPRPRSVPAGTDSAQRRAGGVRPRHLSHEEHPGSIHPHLTLPPYRIKVVEPIPFLTAEQRRQALADAGYNPFNLRADQITIDLLSDSGTGATSVEQEAAAARGDESYAGARSWFRFLDEVRDLTGYPHILPVHQGRAGERVLFSSLLKPGQICVSNTHFDTTHANVVLAGAEPRDLPCPEAADLDSPAPFKGNIDLAALERLLTGPDGHRVGLVLITITNNGLGGQPVSMANLEAVRDLCRRHQVPFFLDAARFAENAWLVGQREAAYQGWTPRQIASRAFSLADGCVVSLKKDGLSAIGGFIGLRDDALHATCEANLIATEGFSTYGGLAGHDLERLAQGLREVVEPAYLASRAAATARFAQMINDAGVDIIQPPGIHALYLNAGRLLPHLSPGDFPGHSLGCQLYLDGGIRCAELGSLYLGRMDDQHRLVTPAPFELVRLAIPRRVYTEAHFEYVAAILADIAKDPERVQGYRIVSAPPLLRHFKVRLAPKEAEYSVVG